MANNYKLKFFVVDKENPSYYDEISIPITSEKSVNVFDQRSRDNFMADHIRQLNIADKVFYVSIFSVEDSGDERQLFTSLKGDFFDKMKPKVDPENGPTLNDYSETPSYTPQNDYSYLDKGGRESQQTQVQESSTSTVGDVRKDRDFNRPVPENRLLKDSEIISVLLRNPSAVFISESGDSIVYFKQNESGNMELMKLDKDSYEEVAFTITIYSDPQEEPLWKPADPASLMSMLTSILNNRR